MDGELPRYTDPELEPLHETARRQSITSGSRPSLDRRHSRRHGSGRDSPRKSTSRPSRRSTEPSSSRDVAIEDESADDESSGFLPRTNTLSSTADSHDSSALLLSPTVSNVSNSKRPISDQMSFEDSDVTASALEDPIDNSPYEQVRASVSAVDDLTLSINTPRMWILSMLFAVLGSSTNLFFSLRYPSVTLTPVVALLLVHPLGLLWDRFVKRSSDPQEIFEHGNLDSRAPITLGQSTNLSPFQGFRSRVRLWLAQGRWNQKEHACVYIAANVSFGFAFATDVIVEQSQFYHQDTTVPYQIALVLSTQILGYSLAGLFKTFLVRPSGMIWPGNLMATAMFSTLHHEESFLTRTISRWRFFVIAFFSSFAFYFLPGLLMPALSYFNVITWFAPDNIVIANLFGVSSGLGMFPVTFDWSQIAYTGSPLVTPFWAAMNVLGGLVVVMWIIAPVMYYSNSLYSAYMPLLSSAVFDNQGDYYHVSQILTPNYILDEEAYRNYSRVFLPITYALSYAIQFASMTALLSHTVCWHGRDIWHQLKQIFGSVRLQEEQAYQPLNNSSPSKSPDPNGSSRPGKLSKPAPDRIMDAEDVHNRLMNRYAEVPQIWYLTTGVITLAVGMFLVEHYEIHLPWWGVLLALGICLLLFLPIGIVYAVTNLQVSIYLISQIAAGVIFPGRGVANMIFVTYAYITSTQGLKFASDLKLGHYMKVPPRLLFAVQLAATIVSSLSQIGVLNWMLANIPNICTPQAINGFTCPIARVHFNGSVLWGVIGPSRFFGPGALYQPLLWAFIIGIIAPVVVWYLAQRQYKKNLDRDCDSSFWTKVNFPVIFGSLSWIPPATGLNFSVWALVCFIFNYVVKNRRPEWWKKYTMTLSAALDAGVAFGVLVIFFAVVYPGFSAGLTWFGTEIYKMGCDWNACPLKSLNEGERFGPPNW